MATPDICQTYAIDVITDLMKQENFYVKSPNYWYIGTFSVCQSKQLVGAQVTNHSILLMNGKKIEINRKKLQPIKKSIVILCW